MQGKPPEPGDRWGCASKSQADTAGMAKVSTVHRGFKW